jgi:hypothetical protein
MWLLGEVVRPDPGRSRSRSHIDYGAAVYGLSRALGFFSICMRSSS